jgi:predicted phosphodiesterase
MRRALQISFLSFILVSCSTSRLYYSSDAEKWKGNIPDTNQELIYELFLIGDAGSPSLDIQEPNLKLLQSKLANSSEHSAVVFLGDNIYLNGLPDSTHPDRKFYEGRIIEQMKTVKDFKGKVIFVPGNHDWDDGGKDGLAAVRRQEEFVENYLNRGNTFLPDNGFPGPVDIELMDDDEHPLLRDDIRLIVLDTQWWLHKYEKPYGDTGEYELFDGGDFLNEFEDILIKRQKDFLVVAAHHPLITKGRHGGYLHPSAHLKPPVFGTFNVLYRRIFGLEQDVNHHKYRNMADTFRELFNNNDHLIYASGHSHNLQYIREEGKRETRHYVVTGAGTKDSYVASGRGTEFSYQGEGFTKLKYFGDGSVWLEAWTHDGTEQGSLLYKTQLKPPYDDPLEKELALPDIDYTDSTKVLAANPNYDGKGFLFEAIVGGHNRKYWSVESEFPVFDVSEINGGLIPVRMGGKGQSNTLHLEDKEGNEFVLRSVDKQAGKIWDENLKKTFALDVAQDQFSILNPYGALVIPPLANAIGVYHTNPKIYYVPNDPLLGRYGDQIGGQLGLFEEKPDNDMSHLESVGRSEEVVAYRDMIREVDGDIDHRVDQEMFTRARLLDMLIGDWDRHSDQWRWATFEPEDEQGKIYRPIPRDRDVAFMKMDGIVPTLMKYGSFFQYQNFGNSYGNLVGLNYNSLDQTRRFTNQLTKEDWSRIALEVSSELTDSVIENAVKRYPEEVFEKYGSETINHLKSRRDKLLEITDTYYSMLNKIVSIPGSNKRERFIVETMDGDRTRVEVFKLSGKGNLREKYFDRIFTDKETEELRLFGMSGNDEFILKGDADNKTRILVIGGPGDDIFNTEELNRKTSRDVEIFDSEKGNTVSTNHKVHTHFTDDPTVSKYNYEKDFKWNRVFPGYYFEYNSFDGIFIGGGPRIVRYGFRKFPAVSHYLRFNYAPKTGASNLKYDGTWFQRVGLWDLNVSSEVLFPKSFRNFFGLGNETTLQSRSNKFYRARLTRYAFEGSLSRSINQVLSVESGNRLSATIIDDNSDESNILNEFGNGISVTTDQDQWFNTLFTNLSITDVDNSINPKQGYKYSLHANVNIGIRNTSQTFYRLESDYRIFYPIRFSPQIVIANRVGGAHNFGPFPFYESNTIGGTQNLRGFNGRRFSGRSTFYNNTEIRIELLDFYRYLLGGKLGITGFFDTGRVWTDGENSSLWHKGYGGGVWFNAFDSVLINSTVGISDEGTLFEIKAGFFF